MAQLSRKELKKDEVRDTFAHWTDAVLEHQQLTTYLLAVALVIALGVFGWRLYSERLSVKSSAAYDAAMNSYEARVLTPGQPAAEPGELAYPDDKTKYTDAAAKLTAVATQYPHADDGLLAKYYAAVSYERIDKNDQAKQLLQQLSNDNNTEYAAMARFELAKLDDATGDSNGAAKLYQQLIDKPAVLVPKPVAMLALAEHYQKSDPNQAAKLLGQIKTDYPDTPIADQADQDLSMLPGNS